MSTFSTFRRRSASLIGDVGLGLAVAVRLDDLVLAEDPALFVDVVDHHLGAPPAVEGSGGGERSRVVVQEADLDGLRLLRLARRRNGDEGHEGEGEQGQHGARMLH
jgi:hypothetical protein